MPAFPPAPPPRKHSRKKLLLIFCLGLALLVLLVLFLGGRTYKNYRLTAAAVERFHDQLNRADYDGIYEEASDDFRRSGTHEDFVKFLDNVHQKMGAAGKMSRLGFHVSWLKGRTFADAVESTEFSQGKAQETFVWVMQSDHLQLYSYRIDSTNLH